MYLLKIDNLSIKFTGAKLPTVKNLSLSIKAGEVLALVGESGSGKSLTAQAIMRLLPEDLLSYPTGSIKLEDTEILKLNARQLQNIRGNRVGMVFQEPMSALNPLHNIGRQIMEAVRTHQPVSKFQAQAQTLQLLDDVGLSYLKQRLNAYPHQLSGGERQRIVLAIAIANRPALLIADEPTTALDVSIQAQILALLDELRQKYKLSMLLITHDLHLAKRIADNIAIMYQGEIVEQQATAQIFAHPQHAYTQKLLADAKPHLLAPAPNNALEILSCQNLQVSYKIENGFWDFKKNRKLVLNNISLSIKKGETLAIVGESGSGKTTLGLAILRLIKSEGKISLHGKDFRKLNSEQLRLARAKIQFVFQDPFSSLNPRMNIAEIIGEGLNIHQPLLSTAQKEEKIKTILAEVGLNGDMLNRYPHEFSGGQRQRIAIARAIILEPDLIVMDEPTSALDLSLQAQIIKILKDLQIKYGSSYIFITHDLRVVKSLAHRVIVLCGGKEVEHGNTEQVFTHPQHKYTIQLMQAAQL